VKCERHRGAPLGNLDGDRPHPIKGALINEVVPGSAAALAGIRGMRPGQLGDIIIEIEDNPIATGTDLRSFLHGRKDGDKISLVFMRGNEKKQESVTLKTLE
jgi:2-alkenal reductase